MSLESEPGFDENRIVRGLQARFGVGGGSLRLGIGDDAAVWHPTGSRELWALTTDMLLEDVDFRRSWLTPAQLGHKSLAVNLSDLAAMGVRPRFFTVALALPEDIGQPWIRALYGGMADLARRHACRLIGGDLSRSPSGIQITVAAIGETHGGKVARRSGGRPGDILYVTGILGKAAAGLALLEQGRTRARSAGERAALAAHRVPEPRCREGEWLIRNRFVRAMMDLSDGLSMDLHRLCSASGTGAEIYLSELPVFAAARRWGEDPEQLALHGGEDFELLFAVPAWKAELLDRSYPKSFPAVRRIGRLRRGRRVLQAPRPGTTLRPLIAGGFDHFRPRSTPR